MKKMNSKTRSRIAILVLCLVAMGIYAQQLLEKKKQEKSTVAIAEQMAAQSTREKATAKVKYEGMEIPTLRNGQPEQVIKHTAYTVSYNPKWLIPNWVAYELTNKETEGEKERTNKFLPDPLVEGDAVVTGDYKGSGYDRGHMAPAADMKWSEVAMKESFYMTNICPQNHNNNAGDWKDLEMMARDWAGKFGCIYICCGPIVKEGAATIGTERKITVPTSFYKVFLRHTGEKWTSIGFVMENAAGSRPLMTYMHSVNEVEDLTGIDFFPQLPDEVEESIESDFIVSDWSL